MQAATLGKNYGLNQNKTQVLLSIYEVAVNFLCDK
jgi:hypothetical protein